MSAVPSCMRLNKEISATQRAQGRARVGAGAGAGVPHVAGGRWQMAEAHRPRHMRCVHV